MRNKTSLVCLAAACLTWAGCKADPQAQSDPEPVESVEIDLPAAQPAEHDSAVESVPDAPQRSAAPTSTGGYLDTYRADTRENIESLEKNMKPLESVPSKGADSVPRPPDPENDDDTGGNPSVVGA